MLPETDDAAVQADAYIDSLLSGHARTPVAVPADEPVRSPGVRDAIRLLERGLPRFHPSFLFEEWLADQLRRAADSGSATLGEVRGRVIPIAVVRPSDAGLGLKLAAERRLVADRRLLVGGAIASGMSLASIAGAAVIVWRRRHD